MSGLRSTFQCTEGRLMADSGLMGTGSPGPGRGFRTRLRIQPVFRERPLRGNLAMAGLLHKLAGTLPQHDEIEGFVACGSDLSDA
jgi:hypothetical protein